MMNEIEDTIGKVVQKAATKLSPVTYINGVVRRMDRDDVEQLAAAYLLAQVKLRQRSTVATVERASQKPKRGTKAWYAWLETPAGADQMALEVEYERIERESQTKLWNGMAEIIENYKNELRMEWTDELLRSDFALADGTKVKWGDATREQHEWRADMHAKNAAAGIEGAARHRAAIELLDQTGTESLNDAVAVPA